MRDAVCLDIRNLVEGHLIVRSVVHLVWLFIVVAATPATDDVSIGEIIIVIELHEGGCV